MGLYNFEIVPQSFFSRNRRNILVIGGIASLIITVATILAILDIRQSGSAPAAATPTPTPAASNIAAHVQITNAGVLVTNTGSVDFPSLTLKLNMNKWGNDDGQSSIGGLAKGRSVTIPYGKFTVGTKRFDIRTTEILTVYVKSGDGSSKLFLCPGTICQPA